MITGVDVSGHQPTWTPQPDDEFVFIKATEGRTYTSRHMAGQVDAARAKGLVVGFYHFMWPGNAVAQAAFFVEKALMKPGDLLVCDWENTGGGTPTEADKDALMAEVKRLRPEHRVGLYCNASMWNGSKKRAGDFLWVAHYGVTKPNINEPWTFWQWTDNPIDQNHGQFASKATLRSWAEALQEDAVKAPYPTTSGNPGLICSCIRDALPLIEYRFKQRDWIREDFSGLVTQWGYKNNDVDASSTTHNGGGVMDVRWSLVDTDEKLRVWQECGTAPFRRRPPQWSLTTHGHICFIGCQHIDPLAARQVADYRNGENGLGGATNHTSYDGPIYVKRTWQDAQRVYADLIEEMDMPTVAEVWDKDLTLGPGVHSAGWYIREIHKMTKAANARTIVLAGATEKILAKLAADDPGEAQLQADLAAVRAELEALAAEDAEPEAAEAEASGPDDPYAPPHETDPQ